MKFSGKKGDMQEILEKLMHNLEKDKIDIESVKNEIKQINKKGEVNIQKVGLIRYNPFPDTGGDQSFVLALLDKNSNGILISSLHARTTTRWYAKKVVNNRVYGGTQSLPMKVDTGGVMPPILASSLLAAPATFASFVPEGITNDIPSNTLAPFSYWNDTF